MLLSAYATAESLFGTIELSMFMAVTDPVRMNQSGLTV